VTETYLAAYSAWKALARAWSAEYDDALAQAQAASEAIRNMDLHTAAKRKASGIYSTLTAMLAASPASKVDVIVFSDLEENGSRQGEPPVGKSGKVILVVPAPDGDMRAANERAEAMSQMMASWGFEKAKVFVPDLLNEAVEDLFSNDTGGD
jgi:hypothetical protein